MRRDDKGFWVDTHRNPADAGSRGGRIGVRTRAVGPVREWVSRALRTDEKGCEGMRRRIWGAPAGPYGA